MFKTTTHHETRDTTVLIVGPTMLDFYMCEFMWRNRVKLAYASRMPSRRFWQILLSSGLRRIRTLLINIFMSGNNFLGDGNFFLYVITIVHLSCTEILRII